MLLVKHTLLLKAMGRTKAGSAAMLGRLHLSCLSRRTTSRKTDTSKVPGVREMVSALTMIDCFYSAVKSGFKRVLRTLAPQRSCSKPLNSWLRKVGIREESKLIFPFLRWCGLARRYWIKRDH